MIDIEFEGNDHILLSRDERVGIWLNVESGVVKEDPDSTLDDTPILGWEIIRGGQTVWRR